MAFYHDMGLGISIHSLRMEGDKSGKIFFVQCCISIHSLRMEGDEEVLLCTGMTHYFNPLPPHGGRRKLFIQFNDFIHISIHSLRMEGDNTYYALDNKQDISIHSLRMEGDCQGKGVFLWITVFQSTPSAWRETCSLLSLPGCKLYFNPLPPHGGRLSPVGVCARCK